MHAEPPQLTERSRGPPDIAHESRLRDLEIDEPRIDLRHAQNRGDAIRERGRHDLHRRDVHGDALRGTPVLPVSSLEAHRLEHPVADRHDQAARFGDRNEPVGLYRHAACIRPTQQRFETPDAASRQFHLRLVEEVELAGVQSPPQPVLDPHRGQQIFGHRRLVERIALDAAPRAHDASRMLRAVHERVDVRAVARRHADADRAADERLLTVQIHRLADHVDESLNDAADRVDVARVGQQHAELARPERRRRR